MVHVVLADHHFPFVDREAVKAAHRVAKRVKPHTIWLLGDVIDFPALSRFRDAQRYEHTVQDELDEVLDYLIELRRAFPEAVIRYMLGNHERRLKYYLWSHASKIKSLRAARFEHQFRFDKRDRPLYLGITFHYKPYTFAKRTFVLKHGTRSNLYATRWEAEDEGRSGLSGHMHRTSTWVWRTPGGGLRRYDHIGCLCGLDPRYREDDGAPSHWNHGMGILYVEDRHVQVENIVIENGEAHWRGQRV